MNGGRLARTAALAAVGATLVALVIDPLRGLFAASVADGGFGRYLALLAEPVHRAALKESLVLSAASVVGAFLVGVPLALLTHDLGRFGRVLRGAAFAPLLLTPVLGVLGFYFLCGRGGVLARFVPGYEGDFRGFGAVLTVHAATLFPFFFSFPAAALERFDRGLIDAARSLGASPLRAFVGVVLPALVPGLVGAGALTFMSAMASFTAPYVFGGGERVLTVAIVVARQDAPADAAALSMVLLAASLASLLPLALLRKRAAGSKGSGARSARSPGGGGMRFVRGAIATVVSTIVFLPLAVVLLVSFKTDGRLGREDLFAGLSTEHYRTALSGLFSRDGFGPAAELAACIGRSLLFAFIATALGAVFALVLSLTARTAGGPVRLVLFAAAALPFAVPGTALALALLESFASRGPFGLGGGLIGSIALLPLAYFVRNLPLHVRATEAAMAQLPSDVESASRTLGRGAVATALRVTLPLLVPGVVSGALLAFFAGAGEFVASVLLCTVFTKPASVAIYEQFAGADFGGAAAAGTILAVLTALAAGLLRGAAQLFARVR